VARGNEEEAHGARYKRGRLQRGVAIESSCNTVTGAGCVNPPPGAQSYPFYSTKADGSSCTWQEGGPFLPGTINDFGGSSATEFGLLLLTTYRAAGFTTVQRFENFNSGNLPNADPVG
jgi:hypothetical protein